LIEGLAARHDADSRRPAEVERRVGAVRALVADRGAQAALLRTRRNISWLTAGSETHIVLSTETAVAAILVGHHDVICVTQNIEAARIEQEELAGLDIETVPVDWWEPGAVEREAGRRAGGAILHDEDLEPDLVPLRSVLAPVDAERMVELGRIGRDAVEAALAAVQPGQTELDLSARVLAELGGIRAPVVLVAADERLSRYRHPLPKPVPIRRRVMLVIVAERWGLHVALTRIRELEPAGPELEERMARTRDVERAMHEATVVGATLGDVLAAAQRAYAEAGFPDEWRDHHQGGSIAYQGREAIATPRSAIPIEAGMAFAWNPSIAGAKVEDTFLLAPDGSQRVITA
jgi:Xaa-Pro dipeptidase